MLPQSLPCLGGAIPYFGQRRLTFCQVGPWLLIRHWRNLVHDSYFYFLNLVRMFMFQELLTGGAY